MDWFQDACDLSCSRAIAIAIGDAMSGPSVKLTLYTWYMGMEPRPSDADAPWKSLWVVYMT